MAEYTWGEASRAPGSHLGPMRPSIDHGGLGHGGLDHGSPPGMLEAGHSHPPSPTYHKIRTSSGDSCRMRNQILGLGNLLLPTSSTSRTSSPPVTSRGGGGAEIYGGTVV